MFFLSKKMFLLFYWIFFVFDMLNCCLLNFSAHAFEQQLKAAIKRRQHFHVPILLRKAKFLEDAGARKVMKDKNCRRKAWIFIYGKLTCIIIKYYKLFALTSMLLHLSDFAEIFWNCWNGFLRNGFKISENGNSFLKYFLYLRKFINY